MTEETFVKAIETLNSETPVNLCAHCHTEFKEGDFIIHGCYRYVGKLICNNCSLYDC